jgi:hypothetical protein
MSYEEEDTCHMRRRTRARARERERAREKERDRLASLGRERDILSKAGRRDQRAHIANPRVFHVALGL